jgi:hypothetical protein
VSPQSRSTSHRSIRLLMPFSLSRCQVTIEQRRRPQWAGEMGGTVRTMGQGHDPSGHSVSGIAEQCQPL